MIAFIVTSTVGGAGAACYVKVLDLGNCELYKMV